MSSQRVASTFPFVLDRLREQDIPAIMAIEEQSFSLPWTPGIYRYELRHNRYGHYLAIRCSEPELPPLAGYAGAWLYLPEAHISTIAIHPDLRGLHLGAWLLAALLVSATQEGALEATLEVRVSNRVAQRLYLSFGFRVVGQRYRYYSDNLEDAYIMSLQPLDLPMLQHRLWREEQIARRRWVGRVAARQVRVESQVRK